MIEQVYLNVAAWMLGQRQRNQFSRHDIARLTGLTEAAIENIEAGKQKIYYHEYAAIRQALDTDNVEASRARLKEMDEPKPVLLLPPPKQSHKSLEERDRKIAELYSSTELSQKEIGQRFGVSRQRVASVIERYNLPQRRAPYTHKIKKLTEEQREKILDLYEARELLVDEIAEMFDVSRYIIQRVWSESGRKLPKTRRRFLIRLTEEQKDEIVKQYQALVPVLAISKAFGVKRKIIQNVIRERNVPFRKPVKTEATHAKHKRRLTVQETNEVVALYRDTKLTLEEIGDQFNIGHNRVLKIANAAGVHRQRRAREHMRAVDHDKVVEAYLQGKSNVEIARVYGISETAVRKIVKKAGLPAKGQAIEQSDRNRMIAADYDKGGPLKAIAEKYGISTQRVTQIGQTYGVRRVKPPAVVRTERPKRQKLDDKQKRNLIEMYRRGILPVKEIAARFGVSKSYVKSLISIHDVPRRSISPPPKKVKLSKREQQIADYGKDRPFVNVQKMFGIEREAYALIMQKARVVQQNQA